MSLSQIKSICEEYPNLGVNGFMSVPCSADVAADNLHGLLQSIDDINFVAGWLCGVEKTKTISMRCSIGYALKYIEPKSPKKHLSDGVFIVGAIIAGFVFVRSHNGNGPNVYFNMSCKSIARKSGKPLPFEVGYSAISLARGM